MASAGAVRSDPIASHAIDTATDAARLAQDYATRLAETIRRQPFVALAVGMAAAYLLGRVVTTIRR